MLHPDAARLTRRYLSVADRLLPGRITHFYVVGSAALGAWRAGGSDIDVVVAVDGGFTAGDLRRLRVLHPVGNATPVVRALLRARVTVPGTVNAVYVSAADLRRPVTAIRPLASHTGNSFARGRAFDVNPVVWKVLRERGIPLRGPAPGTLGLDPEPERLRAWNLENLHGYWHPWAEKALAGKTPGKPLVAARSAGRSLTTWGALGVSRLHRTVATGDIVSKEGAGEYALDTFAPCWHPLIRTALAHRRAEPLPAGLARDPDLADRARRLRLTGAFVMEVIADADRL
ncbi:aminoglycoside adenylyltransferase domain-containing protein [Streptomyces sp. NPDC088197]|uniref:aminoglycoside adenylyltransferase domain-containing protein n=1 Tax=Streptomyces sp. NPDC088197 TaxID=3365840 RepID=UPI00382B7599